MKYAHLVAPALVVIWLSVMPCHYELDQTPQLASHGLCVIGAFDSQQTCMELTGLVNAHTQDTQTPGSGSATVIPQTAQLQSCMTATEYERHQVDQAAPVVVTVEPATH